MQQPYTFIFLGRAGSGKGTQVALLKKYVSEKTNLEPLAIDMGGIFRSFIGQESAAAKATKEVMQAGRLLPDFLTNSLFVKNAADMVDETSPLFFDGFPRSLGQLETVKKFLEFVGRTKPVVINVNVSAESVKGRMKLRGRGDDTESAIEQRLAEYDRSVVPMIEAAKNDPFFTYIEIDGEPAIEEIHQTIITKIGL